jgi:hypothetical protein
MTHDLDGLAARYVALWNEPDADARRDAVRSLWTDDAVHLLQPPAEYLDAATALGFPDATLEARGHDALTVRVTRAYDEFVAPGAYAFVPRGRASRLRDVVRLPWAMVARDGGEVAGAGVDVLLLAPDGRIAADYQFVGE